MPTNSVPRHAWQTYEPAEHYSPARWVHSDMWAPLYDKLCAWCDVICGVSRVPNSSGICEQCAGELTAGLPE